MILFVMALREQVNRRITAPTQVVVWPGQKNVGLGNVLLGFANAYYAALRTNAELCIHVETPVVATMASAFELGFNVSQKAGMVVGGLSFRGIPEEEAIEYFGEEHLKLCKPGVADRDALLMTSWTHAGFPCGLQAALRALILEPRGLRTHRDAFFAAIRGNTAVLDPLLDDQFEFAAAVHIRTQMRWVEDHRSEAEGKKETTAFLEQANFTDIANQLKEMAAGGDVYVASDAVAVCEALASFLEPLRVTYVAFARTRGTKVSGARELMPYFDWWALAHSRYIISRRHSDLRRKYSTFSHTAFAWGMDISAVHHTKTIHGFGFEG